MNIERIFRALMCLVLICCLIAQMVPARANAIGLSGTVATGTAIAAGLVALGIGVGATETAFNNLVDSLTAVAGSDRVPVWISETADGFVTYLQESFLGSLLAHCFDTGVLTEDLVLSDTLNFTYRGVSHTAQFWTYDGVGSAYVATGSYPSSDGLMRYDTRVIFYSPNSDRIKIDGSSSSVYDMKEISGSFYYSSFVTRSTDPEVLNVSSSLPIIALGSFPSGDDYIAAAYGVPPGAVSTSEDLTLGSVGVAMSSPNYDPWRTAAIPVVPPVVGGGTADEEDALPVTFPGLDTPSITGQTQTGAQSGITSGTVVEDILSGGEVVPDTGTGTIADVIAAIKAIPASLADFFADVVAAVQAIPAAFASWLDKILEWLAKIWEAIKAIPGLIAEAFADVLALAFVPAEGYLDAEVTSLCAQYPLADSCMNLITSFHDAFSGLGGEPPVIYIHLEDYEGSYNIGGTVPILDMRWYARYKPTVDTLLSSLLWIFFIWRVLVHAPSIISGVAGDVEAFNSGPSGGYFSADNPYRGQFERPARGRFESRRNRK